MNGTVRVPGSGSFNTPNVIQAVNVSLIPVNEGVERVLRSQTPSISDPISQTSAIGAEALEAFLKKLAGEVSKYWTAPQLTNCDVARALQGEISELMQWRVKEKRYGVSHAKDIAEEVVDSFFYLAKLAEMQGVGIRATWTAMTNSTNRRNTLREAGEQEIEEVTQKIAFSAAFIGQLLTKKGPVVARVEYLSPSETENNDPEKVQYWTIPATICVVAYLNLKLIERLGIDFEAEWQRKMEINRQKAESQS